jgi:acyl-CoA reductase-like NAD-dependent aldehyde dehydrogenase
VFSGVNNQMKIAREEIFGPVAAAIPFEDETDAVFQGNDTEYGLAAAVWTRDVSRAHKVRRALKAGTVWMNCYNSIDPISSFGGCKQAGFGREIGKALARIVHTNQIRLREIVDIRRRIWQQQFRR